MFEFILWLIFIYIVAQFVRAAIRSAVNRGIRDYEKRKETQRRNEKEVKIDRKNIQDAEFKDLK